MKLRRNSYYLTPREFFCQLARDAVMSTAIACMIAGAIYLLGQPG